MRRFCANKLCGWHELEDNGIGHMRRNIPMDDFEHKSEMIESRNHLYRNGSGSTEFYLCDTCHAAVRIVKNS